MKARIKKKGNLDCSMYIRLIYLSLGQSHPISVA